MKEIGLNRLPEYNPWVARLLGEQSFTSVKRNAEKLKSEYELSKYAKLLEYIDAGNITTMEQAKNCELNDFSIGKIVDERMCVSIGGKLYIVIRNEYKRMLQNVLTHYIGEYIGNISTIVELGCGYGYNLEWLNSQYEGKRWIGGEYSNNGILCANKLLKKEKNIRIMDFDWHHQDWEIFGQYEGKALVFTRHCVEVLPIAEKVLHKFQKYRDKIACVVHLEPIDEMHQENTTLGLLRKAYARLNDYNTDMLGALKRMGIKIIGSEYDVIGGNPLDPTSILVWRFE